LSRDRLPRGADFFFFTAFLIRATLARGRVSRLDFSGRVQVMCACTKHLWRFYRQRDGGCRATLHRPLRPRNVSVPSYRPMQRRSCMSPMHQLVPGSGEGQHTSTVCDSRRLCRSWSRRPIKRSGSGNRAYVLIGVRRRRELIIAERYLQANPVVTQLGCRLAYSTPSLVEKLVQIERGISR
jgi:hypothetical protein